MHAPYIRHDRHKPREERIYKVRDGSMYSIREKHIEKETSNTLWERWKQLARGIDLPERRTKYHEPAPLVYKHSVTASGSTPLRYNGHSKPAYDPYRSGRGARPGDSEYSPLQYKHTATESGSGPLVYKHAYPAPPPVFMEEEESDEGFGAPPPAFDPVGPPTFTPRKEATTPKDK